MEAQQSCHKRKDFDSTCEGQRQKQYLSKNGKTNCKQKVQEYMSKLEHVSQKLAFNRNKNFPIHNTLHFVYSRHLALTHSRHLLACLFTT